MSFRPGGLAAPFAVLLSLLGMLAPAAARPVAASCLPLDLAAVVRTDATSVFAGTVTRTESGHVWVRVEHWFLGKDPIDSAEIIGGSQPNVITSADWMPSPGERYLVVAERAAATGFVTRPCQQASVTVAVLEQAGSVFGVPREPPFATPTPRADPASGAAREASPWDPVLPALLLVAAAAGAVILVTLLRRRRSSGIIRTR